MKKYLTILALLCSTFAQAQEWVSRDSVSTILSSTDIDSIYFIFPAGLLPKMMASDTTKASVPYIAPPSFVRMAGDMDLWIDRTAIAGVADSLRGWYKVIDPFTGRPARNDSSFFLGSASLFADPTSTSRYSITLPASFGVFFMFQQADEDSVNIVTRITAKISYTQ